MLSFSQELEQKQILSQKQIYSLHILALNNYELEQFLSKEELDNPLLEVQNAAAKESPGAVAVYDFCDRPGSRRKKNDEDADSYWEKLSLFRAEEDHIADHFRWQLKEKLSPKDARIFDYLLALMDDRGYVSANDGEIAQALQAPLPDVSRMRQKLQRMDPAGVGACSLQECLCIQIDRFHHGNPLCKLLICQELESLAAGNYGKIALRHKISKEEVRACAQIIRLLNPIPLNGWGTGQPAYVIPDIIFEKTETGWEIRLNASSAPTIDIRPEYRQLMKTTTDAKTLQYCEQKKNELFFLKKCLEQRKSTLLKISQCILNRQSDFCLGKSPLKPMRLSDAAAEIGIHESTVSRAIQNKYLQTPAGVYRMKELFTQAFSRGEDDASDSVGEDLVKDMIAELVRGEDKKAPLSDAKLTALLQERGIQIARRTVAKYREALGIGSTRVRKES